MIYFRGNSSGRRRKYGRSRRSPRNIKLALHSVADLGCCGDSVEAAVRPWTTTPRLHARGTVRSLAPVPSRDGACREIAQVGEVLR